MPGPGHQHRGNRGSTGRLSGVSQGHPRREGTSGPNDRNTSERGALTCAQPLTSVTHVILKGHTEARGSVQTQAPTLQQNTSLPVAPPGPSASRSALPAVAGSLLLSELLRGTQTPHPQWGRGCGQLSTLLLSPPPSPCPAEVTHVSVPPSVTGKSSCFVRVARRVVSLKAGGQAQAWPGPWGALGHPSSALGPFLSCLSRKSPGKGGSLMPLPVLLCDGSKIQKVK